MPTTVFIAAVAVSVVGCGATYYDPQPPITATTQVLAFTGTRTVEQAYRLLYERLQTCFSSAYHLQPRFLRSEARAQLLLVSGLGLNRYSVIGNSFVARIDVHAAPSGPRETAEITLTLAGEELRVLESLLPAWLDGDTRCSPR